MAIKRIVVRYRTKPEAADANAQLIAQVFQELQGQGPGRGALLGAAFGGRYLHPCQPCWRPSMQRARSRNWKPFAASAASRSVTLEPPQSSTATHGSALPRAFGEA